MNYLNNDIPMLSGKTVDIDADKYDFPEIEDEYEYQPIDESIGKEVSDTLLDELELDGKPSQKEIIEAVGSLVLEMAKEGALSKTPRDDKIREIVDIINLEAPDRQSPLGMEGANIRTTLMYTHLAALHAFIYQTMTGIRPFLKTEPCDPASTQPANKLEDFYDAQYTEGGPLTAMLDKAIYSALMSGFCVFKPTWVYDTRVVPVTEVLSPDNAEDMGYSMPKEAQPNAVLKHKSGRQARLGQVVNEKKRITVQDAPEIQLVDYFDFVISPADCTDVDAAAFVGERKVEAISSLHRCAKNMIYDPDAVKHVIEHAKRISSDNPTNIFSDSAVDPTTRTSELDRPSDTKLKTGRFIETVKGIVRLDLDGDDESEDWMITIETSTGCVLTLRPYTYSTSLRNYRPVVPVPRAQSLYGMSIGDILLGIQEQSDTAVNIALDGAALASTVIVEELRNSSTMGEKLHVGINHRKVNEFGNLKVHPLFQGADGKMYPSIPLIEKQASDATALSETLQGSVNDKGEVTATETNQALVAGSRRLEVVSRRFQRALVEAHRIVHNMYCSYYTAMLNGDMNAQIPYSKRGADGSVTFGTITLGEFLTPVKWFAHGDTTNTNQALKLQAAEKVFLMASQSPLVANKMERLYNATKFAYEAYGIRNVPDYIGTLEEARQMDEQNAQKEQSVPQFELPNVEPSVNAFYFATMVAKNPELGQQLIEALAQTFQAQAGAEAQDQSQSIELKNQFMEHNSKLKEQQLKIKEAAMGLDMKKKEVEMAGKHVAMAHQNASMELDAQGQQLAHQHEMQQQEMQHAALKHEAITNQADQEHELKANDLKFKETKLKQQERQSATKK